MNDEIHEKNHYKQIAFFMFFLQQIVRILTIKHKNKTQATILQILRKAIRFMLDRIQAT